MRTVRKSIGWLPGTLARLAADTAGNTMLMMAAALIPLSGMMGGAVDLSRAYLVKARMQQACDAGSLAGRRSMTGKVMTEADKSEAFRYFFYNFPNETMGAKPMVKDDAAATDRVVANLNAEAQFAMAATTEVPTTLLRLVGIRDIRVAVSCVAEEFFVNTDIMFVLDTTGSMNCSIFDPSTCSQSTEKSNSKMKEMRNALKQLYADLIPAQTALASKNLRMRFGIVQYAATVNVGKLIQAENAGYIRNPYQYRNSSGGLKTAHSHSNTWFSNSWQGCIEERRTSNFINGSTTSIPSDALDLDMATKPNGDVATQWAPYDEVQEEGKSSFACPKPATHLRTWDQTDFDNHVDKIVTGKGATYHDIGMIWGTRMITNVGIFGDRNPNFYNDVKVARTIVFMTDGVLQPNRSTYSAYGVQRFAGRVAPPGAGDGELKTRHERRFNLMCNVAKQLGADIWVIVVSSAKTASLEQCASNAKQAILVNNTAELSEAFKKISDKVGNLRIGA